MFWQIAVGGVPALSTTVIVAIQLDTFPFISVTVSVTVFAPTFKQLNESCDCPEIAIEAIPQLSLEPLSICAAVTTAFPFTSNATVNLLGITTSGSGVAAVSGLFGTFVIIRGNVVNTDTYSAIYAGRIVINDNVTSWQFKDSTNTIIRTLYTAGVALGNPATSNVRFGTTYGASLELTGTMRVPSAANVLQGVLVDNTVGTLLMTPAQCWNYLISSGFTPNSIGDRLQNASTVATTGSQIASYNI